MLVELAVVEQRYRAVMEVLEGTRVTEVTRRFGVARQMLDAHIARAVLGPTSTAVPKSKSGTVEVVRTLRVTRPARSRPARKRPTPCGAS